jgi:valyl-tRNA synthetase
VLDTWATSSLTPWIAGDRWGDPDLFDRVFPYDLHPQGARDHPHLAVHRGAALAPGAGPAALVGHRDLGLGARPGPEEDVQVARQRDHARPSRWTSSGRTRCATGRPSARLGVDTAYDPGQLRVGRRLAVKLLNVARFVLGLPEPSSDRPTAAVDRAALARLADTVQTATAAFDRYDHAGRWRRPSRTRGGSATTTWSW